MCTGCCPAAFTWRKVRKAWGLSMRRYVPSRAPPRDLLAARWGRLDPHRSLASSGPSGPSGLAPALIHEDIPEAMPLNARNGRNAGCSKRALASRTSRYRCILNVGHQRKTSHWHPTHLGGQHSCRPPGMLESAEMLEKKCNGRRG